MLRCIDRAGALLVIAASVLAGAGCARSPVIETQAPRSAVAAPVDFNGSWEIDYGRSDDVKKAVTRLFRKLNRSAPRSAGGHNSREYSPGTSRRAVESMIALALLAEQVTRSHLLEISQSETGVKVTREDDFALTCEFSDGGAQRMDTVFGTEICGWSGQQMVFHLALPDGTTVHHRVMMAPDGQNLRIMTTVHSVTAPAPLTLSRFYTRFEPLPDEYYCEETFSRKRVCSTHPPES